MKIWMAPVMVLLCIGNLSAQFDDLEFKLEDKFAAGTGKMYTAITSLTLSSEGLELADLDIGPGDFLMKSAEAEEIVVYAKINIKEKSPEAAKDFANMYLKLSLEKSGNKAELESLFKHHDNNKWMKKAYASIDLRVFIPNSLSVEIDDSSGDIDIEEFRNDVKIDDSSGEIEISEVTGNIWIDDSSGEIRISNISRGSSEPTKLTIDDSSGEIVIEKANASCLIDDSSGEIYINELGGSLTIDDTSGDIDAFEIGGDVDIVDDAGDISLKQVMGSVKVEDSSGSIQADGVAKDFIVVDDGAGEVNYNNVKGRVDIKN